MQELGRFIEEKRHGFKERHVYDKIRTYFLKLFSELEVSGNILGTGGREVLRTTFVNVYGF